MVAEQLKSLMERHNLAPADLERLTGGHGKTAISGVTIRHILKAQLRTEPEPATLRRIAEAAGENYLVAFAEEPEQGVVTIDVSLGVTRLFLHGVGGSVPDGLEVDLKKVLEKYEKKRPGSASVAR